MARILPIVKVVQSGGPGTPGRITVAGNLVSSFQGKFYRQDASPHAIAPFYSSATPPAGYSLIAATTFDITGNPSYNGRYTVYTPIDVSDSNPSSVFGAGETEILVNEVVGPPDTAGDELGVGSVTNISTYAIAIQGEAALIIPPTVLFTDRPLDVIGRNGTPWAESYTQNFVKLAQNFAGAEPVNPYLGQTWYDDTANTFNLRTASGWTAIASGVAGSNVTARHEQTTPATTWTVTHGLGLVAPYVALVQVFVDVGGGVHKMILPSDMIFDDANQLTVVFTPVSEGGSNKTGVVLIRA